MSGFFSGCKFKHILLVIEKNNKKYLFHYIDGNYVIYDISLFDTINLNLIEINKFLNEYQKYKPIYRIYKYNDNKINFENLCKNIESLKNNKFNWIKSFFSDNYDSCTTFMAKVLCKYNIIKEY